MIYLWVPVALLLGAFGRRAAGGALNQWAGLSGIDGQPRVMGDTPARLIYGATVALAGLLGGAPWALSLAMIVAVWVGTTTGNFDSLAMGRDGKYSKLHDWLGMTAHAALSAIPPALLLFGYMYWYQVDFAWYWTVGLTMTAAPLYNLGYNIAGHGRTDWPSGLQGGTELAEAFWGAACALGVFLTFAAA